jgi:DNA-binding transcriptional LysR family regulator
MNLGRLRMLHEVARHGTFAGAAEALSYSPSAVSQQMARLEAELDTVLLIRTPRGVELTDAGRALLAHANRILAEVDAAHDDLASHARRVRLGSFPTATQTFLPEALAGYRARRPRAQVRVVDDEPHENLVRLRDGELDLGVVFAVDGRAIGVTYDGRFVCSDDDVMLEPLFDDEYLLATTADDDDGPATIDDLRDRTLIGRPITPGMPRLAAACRARGFEPRFNDFYCADYLTVRALVAAGEGDAVIPRLATARPVEGVKYRTLADAPRRHVLLALPVSGATPAAAAVAAELRSFARDRGPALWGATPVA